MSKRNYLITLIIVTAALITFATAYAAVIDSTERTVTTETLSVDWHDTNPEEIVDIRWMSSPNLTNISATSCGDLEYFGNSWVNQDEQTPSFVFKSIVGWGTTGTWQNPGDSKILLNSISEGCYGSAEVPVKTKYHLFNQGPAANKINVHRSFEFGSTPFPYNFRPYIPRLFPRDEFTTVFYPDASGTNLIADLSDNCEFGCMITDWDGSWFAIHDPSTGRGLIVKREPSTTSAALWVDQDAGSFTNSSSVLLLQPSGGFTGKVIEVEFLCFYDNSTWTPSIDLPPGC
jgi:hypothetical protein